MLVESCMLTRQQRNGVVRDQNYSSILCLAWLYKEFRTLKGEKESNEDRCSIDKGIHWDIVRMLVVPYLTEELSPTTQLKDNPGVSRDA